MDDLKKTLKYIWDRTSDFSQRADMLLLALSCTCALFGITLIASAARALASQLQDSLKVELGSMYHCISYA